MKSCLSRTTVVLLGALAGLAAVVLVLAPPLAAQTVSNAFGGLSQNSKDPIDIESDVLVVHDKEKYATFKGNVKAVQGTTTLRTRELNVHYVGRGDTLAPGAKKENEAEPAPAAKVADAQGTGEAATRGATAPGTTGGAAAAGTKPADNGTQITKIEASGDVVITRQDGQTTTGDWAIYDVPSQLVTVGGNVVLTQDKNVLKGDRLVIDLTTGESRFENPGNTAAGGRIRALFMPKQEGADAKSGDTKPGETKTGATAKDETSGQKSDADAGNEPQNDGKPADDQPWTLLPEMRP